MPSASVHLKQTISSEFWYTSIKCEIILPHIPLSKLDGTDSCHKILCSKELPVVWMTTWEYPISYLHLKGQVHHIIKVQILQLFSLCSCSDSSNNCEMSFSVNFLLFASLGRKCKLLDFFTLFNESFKKKKRWLQTSFIQSWKIMQYSGHQNKETERWSVKIYFTIT